MTIEIGSLDDPAFLALFTGVRKSWFRLETLQTYDAGYERREYLDFLRGVKPSLVPGPWQMMIAHHVAQGRSLRRVHVVELPPSDYVRYEIACPYARNAAAGEDIRVVFTREWPAGIARQDFWLFDDSDVWDMIYDEHGRFQRAKRNNTSLPFAQATRDLALRLPV